MGHGVLIQVCVKSCPRCGVGVAEMHTDSTKSGILTRIESNDRVGRSEPQLLSEIGRSFKVDL